MGFRKLGDEKPMNTELQLDFNGLIPAIVQDDDTGQVLTMGYLSPGALEKSLESGEVWFYSRSRQTMWHKGATSGNYFRIQSIEKDCDNDTLLFHVKPTGPACHTGATSCFFTSWDGSPTFLYHERGSGILEELFAVIQNRALQDSSGSYTAELLRSGVDRVAQKVVEEAGESAIAAVRGKKNDLVGEIADLFYHSFVLLAASGLNPEMVWSELRSRRQGH